MGILLNTYRFVVGNLIRNPTGTASVIMFGLGFSLVAGNAIYSQPQVHPDPFWQTKDMTVTRSLVETVKVKKRPTSITRTVLTQRISLKDIPVPTANPIRKPSSAYQSELVRETQEALASLGLYKGKVDGIYGSGTKVAIVAYQESAGILPDGAASYDLLAGMQSTRAAAKRAETNITKPKPVPEVKAITLQVAKTMDFDRDMVTRIQSGLKDRFGEAEISVDGVYGTQTKDALRRFQKFFDLNPTGEIDQQTLEKLLSAGIIQAI